jgi:hypothetical protein
LCQYLTGDEQQVLLLQMCGLVVVCIRPGGITDDNHLLAIINEIISESCCDVEEDGHIHVCKELLKDMQHKIKDLVKLKMPPSIGPPTPAKRAENATEETWDSMFSRLEYYVKLVVLDKKLDLVPWKSFSDVP